MTEDWEGNYHLQPERGSIRVDKYHSEPFTRGSGDLNVLLYLDRQGFKEDCFDRTLALKLSGFRNLNVAVATRPEIAYAENAQIVIPRLGAGLESELRNAYNDKLILGTPDLRSIDSYAALKRAVPEWRRRVREMALEGVA